MIFCTDLESHTLRSYFSRVSRKSSGKTPEKFIETQRNLENSHDKYRNSQENHRIQTKLLENQRKSTKIMDNY